MKHKVLVLCFLLSQVSFLMGSENYGIAVHGGAGVMKNLSENQKQKIEEQIIKTLTEAFKIIEQGGTSMDAVEFAVSEFEDSPLFNAGRGSVYNSEEVQEIDASIMSGQNRSAGAVASVRTIKNPIKVARKVADLTEHVMLIGEGAEKFAEQIGEEIVSKDYFYSEKNLKRLRKAKNKSTNLNLIQTGQKKFKRYLHLINKYLIIYFGVYFGVFLFGQLTRFYLFGFMHLVWYLLLNLVKLQFISLLFFY